MTSHSMYNASNDHMIDEETGLVSAVLVIFEHISLGLSLHMVIGLLNDLDAQLDLLSQINNIIKSVTSQPFLYTTNVLLFH